MANTDYYRTFLVDCAGVNNSVSDELIGENELADSRNLIPDYTGSGGLIKRSGLVANSSPSSAYGATATAWSRISAYTGKHSKYYTETVTTSAPGYTFNIYSIAYDAEGDATATSLFNDTVNGASASAWCTFDGLDLYVDVGHALKTSDGSSFSAISNIPASTICIEPYNNYLFALINGSNHLRWSDQEDAETWDVSHDLAFPLAGSNDALVSLRAFDGEIAVFSKRKVIFVQGYGPLDFTVSHTVESVGAASHHLTCSTEMGLFWWDITRGLCWTPDGAQIDFPMLRKIPATFYAYSADTPSNGFMLWCPDRMCLSTFMTTATPSYLRADYYPKRDAFFLSSYAVSSNSFRPAAMTCDDLNLSTFSRPLYYMVQRNPTASTGKTYVRRESESVSSDCGDAVTDYATTKKVSSPSPLYGKKATRLKLTTAGAAGTVSYSYFHDNSTTAARTIDVTATEAVKDHPMGLDASYYKIQHQVSDSLTARTEYHALHEAGQLTKEP